MKLFQKPDRDIKSRIAQTFFGITDDRSDLSLEEYFCYYEEELELLRIGTSPSTWQAGHLAANDHEDVLAIVEAVKPGGSETRHQLEQKLSVQFNGAASDCRARSVDLALRLWLLVNVCDVQYQSLRPQSSCVQWNSDETLDACMTNLFPTSRLDVSPKESRLDVHFTAVAMVDICGITIHWTSSLPDHLLLDRRNRVLSVFAHKNVLEAASKTE